MKSAAYIKSCKRTFALRSGVSIDQVDPHVEHYVSGLEHLHISNRPEDFAQLSTDQQKCIIDWIHATLEPATSARSCPGSSYGLKHWFGNQGTSDDRFWHNDRGFYITNGQFKGAMLAAGFEPIDDDECNAVYRVKVRPSVREMIRQAKIAGKSASRLVLEPNGA
jgi:hypothetical protein